MGLRLVGAGRTAVFTNLVPLSGVLLSWLILDKQLRPLRLAGGLLAVAGVVVCQGPEGRGLGREAARALLARAPRPLAACRGSASATPYSTGGGT